jgi:ectoine hydroxylase-related dioxygenase (phytanoyl-CoA dioxygenase family)
VEQELLSVEAGDMVWTHGDILHAGTINMSDATRYFISIFLTVHGLPHRDSFATPQVAQICDGWCAN